MDIEIIKNFAEVYGVNIITGMLILIIGFWLSNRVRSFVWHLGLKYESLDDTLFKFLASLARYAIITLTLVLVLTRLGVETTSLIAVIGAAGLAIGLALQGTLSNLAAGVMLMGFRPFRIGEFIEVAGQSGTVAGVNLFTTELTTPDNVQIIIPNAAVWGSSIVNYSAHDTRRCDMTFGVGYGVNLADAEKIIRDQISADARALSEPAAPLVVVGNLGDSSVDFTVRVWCKASDYWGMKFDLTRGIKEAFDNNGIDIPFPTRTIVNG